MSDPRISMLIMPKWGMTMTEGRVVKWLIPEGANVAAGDELLDVETEKIANAVEAPVAGVLRRHVAGEGQAIPVSGLLAIIADPEVPDAEVDAFVEEFLADFTPEEAESGAEAEGPSPESIQVAERSIRYLKLGEGGEPVLLIHGFGGDQNAWLFNHEVLSADQTVYALDLPGHGGSSKDVGDGTIVDLADVVAGFMDALGLDAAHVVGHSLGGAVAAELALAEPARVLSLTLVSSIGLGSEINGDFVNGFARGQRRGEIKPVLEALFADSTLVTRRLVEDVLRYKRLDGVDAALAAIASSMIADDGTQKVAIRDRLTDYPGSVLVVGGAHDQVVPPGHADGLPETVRTEILDAAGHMPMMESSTEFNRLLLDFLP
jgi:pyruvate dehydrogenase E2 component (dihydrolipoamide acetyltransferase)